MWYWHGWSKELHFENHSSRKILPSNWGGAKKKTFIYFVKGLRLECGKLVYSVESTVHDINTVMSRTQCLRLMGMARPSPGLRTDVKKQLTFSEKQYVQKSTKKMQHENKRKKKHQKKVPCPKDYMVASPNAAFLQRLWTGISWLPPSSWCIQ